MMNERYIGVDGCKAGWFFICIDAAGDANFGIYKNINELWHAFHNATVILIDIPIGLMSKKGIGRACDDAARNVLKPLRHSSIFSPPCSEALSAENYEEACNINQKVCGRKISIFAWGISPKIKEVDDFLQHTPEAIGILRETHPEICFWAMAGYKPMEHKKNSSKGLAERLDQLQKNYAKSTSIYKAALNRYFRKDVKRDDILDALANAVVATQLKGAGATLPTNPPKDQRGLSMEMVYAPPSTFPDETQHPKEIAAMIGRLISEKHLFPETEIFNETWMLRLVLNIFQALKISQHPLKFLPGSRWFSEGLIPSTFLARYRGDKLAESWTHADGIIGHFEAGNMGRADIRLSQDATHVVCVEAKMFSKLSPGVTNARYYNQAARYVACMAEMLKRANRRPEQFEQLGFVIIAPDEQIRADVFTQQMSRGHILETVKRRVAAYEGEKEAWFSDWFLPLLKAIAMKILSWESALEEIVKQRPEDGKNLMAFYRRCLVYNRVK
ncbi:hypothetical protein D3OALGA1CA_5082 [Olavius algarvensis associated proteobacterium Delta 3]|nr:hypothetical protein D3OALGA1CA_5082 [Olavius algarvensis associated proteobacterium Delta 3]